MRFGLGIPTCREGLAYPSGFADLQAIAALARAAEDDGFDALWGNDHLITQQVVMNTLPSPPSFYEPLITFAYLAGQTSRIRFVVGTVVAPMREPVLLAKQAATLDRASNGRFVLGLGIGAYREEFEAIAHPPPKANRGAMLEESLLALRALFDERRTTFSGKYCRFPEIEISPKPVQRPFPIYLGSNSPAGIERAGRLADGLIIAGVSPERTHEAVTSLRQAARDAGRDPAQLQTCVQVWVANGVSPADARTALEDSQHFRRLRALKAGEAVDDLVDTFARSNLYGTAEHINDQLTAYRDAGADLLTVIVLANPIDELTERAHLFAQSIGIFSH
jgi:probable F420-dependent oxidoreductase